jgi:cytochrome P450
MWKLLGLALASFIVYEVYTTLTGLRRNVAAAKASGIPYRVVALGHTVIVWLMIGEPVVRFLETILPASWQGQWLADIHPMQTWVRRYRPYEELGSDMMILVSPQWNWLAVADAEAIAQIVQRRNDFVKPTHFYAGLDLFGKNVITTEGQFWRHHRRIVAPPFNEQNNHLVWEESLHQAQNLMQGWTGKDGNDDAPVSTLVHDAMRLSLYVISKAGFGRSMKWPGVEEDVRATPEPGEKAESRSMTYTRTLDTLIRNIFLVIALPISLLRWAPFKLLREAAFAHDEWVRQMSALYAEKEREMRETDSAGMDLLGGLIKAAGTTKGEPLLSQEEVMGNAFVMLVAGHETTANSIHFSLILLAMNISTQRHVQADLDAIVGDMPPSQWSYEHYLPRLFNSMLGAVMAEQLRLIPPIIDIPKWNTTPQSLTVGDKRYTIPAYTRIGLSAIAVQRNPKYWPHGPPRDTAEPEHPLSNLDNDLEEFKPERWIVEGSRAASSVPASSAPSSPTRGTPKGSPKLLPVERSSTPLREIPLRDTSSRTSTPPTSTLNRSDTLNSSHTHTQAHDIEPPLNAADHPAPPGLFKPVKGAYLPFSEGHRSCLGRRFAQVEFMAVMASILQKWSVELAVDEMDGGKDSDENPDENKARWHRARCKARDALNSQMTTVITLQLKTGVTVPVRFVRRGNERFGVECE